MSEKKCRYFNRNSGDPSKIDLVQDTLYCACADIIEKDGKEIARSACNFQVGCSEQLWFKGVTYWECEIAKDLMNSQDRENANSGVFNAARSYRESIRNLLFS